MLDRVVREAGDITFHYVILDFVGRDPRGTLRCDSDASDVRWVKLDELDRYPTTDGLGPVIARAMQAQDGPHRLSIIDPG